MKKKYNIQIDIDNIKVGRRYYSFDYKFWNNGKLIEEGSYDRSHSRSPNSIRKWLKDHWAYEIVLEKIAEGHKLS